MIWEWICQDIQIIFREINSNVFSLSIVSDLCIFWQLTWKEKAFRGYSLSHFLHFGQMVQKGFGSAWAINSRSKYFCCLKIIKPFQRTITALFYFLSFTSCIIHSHNSHFQQLWQGGIPSSCCTGVFWGWKAEHQNSLTKRAPLLNRVFFLHYLSKPLVPPSRNTWEITRHFPAHSMLSLSTDLSVLADGMHEHPAAATESLSPTAPSQDSSSLLETSQSWVPPALLRLLPPPAHTEWH